MSNKIIKFIDDFKKINPPVIEDLFLHGYRYWFAKILSDRFNGEILYFPVENHFATKINGAIYDITGYCIPDERGYKWDTYKQVDSLDYQRVIRDCINKEDYIEETLHEIYEN